MKYAALDNVKMERAVDALDALGDGKIEDANEGAIKPSALDAMDAPGPPTAVTASTGASLYSDYLVCT